MNTDTSPKHIAEKNTNTMQVLLVDDEADLLRTYTLALRNFDYEIHTAQDLAQAKAALQQQRFDLVVTDMRLPDGLGLELVGYLQERANNEQSVVITAYGSAENAVQALKAGAFDYLSKPIDLQQFRSVIADALAHANNVKRLRIVQEQSLSKADVQLRKLQEMQDKDVPIKAQKAMQALVGNSQLMRELRNYIAKVGPGMAPILIEGDSGTGKELVARALHACSARSSGPFIAVNCGAIPENLLEAEFFGAKKGSYTGANHDRQGYFQAASGGTLFLDEIGELPLAMQSKLLRAIQERMVRAIGATQEERVDVRIISATHKNLAHEVEAGSFRQDLYYRINVLDLHVPALRERREDLPILCQHILQRLSQEAGLAQVPTLSESAMQALMQMEFAGNVRELENLLHRAMVLGTGSMLELQAAQNSLPASKTHIPIETNANNPKFEAITEASGTCVQDLQSHLDQQERVLIEQALQKYGFNRSAAAASLGLSLRQIRYRMQRLGIDGGTTDMQIINDTLQS